MTREEAKKLKVGQKIRIVKEAEVVEGLGADGCLKVTNGLTEFYVYCTIVEPVDKADGNQAFH
jgi:hypothetical protein